MRIIFGNEEDGTYVVCAGNKQAPYGIDYDGRHLVQVAELFNASAVEVVARGNRRVALSFSVDKEYETLADAALAAMKEENRIPRSGTLEVTEDSDGSSGSIMDCALESFRLQQDGVTLRMRYGFVGGGFEGAANNNDIPEPKT